MSPNQKLKDNFYEHYWKSLSETHQEHPANQYRYDLIKSIVKKLRKRPSEELSVLDVGCGDGTLLGIIRSMGKWKSVHGLDISPAATSNGREQNDDFVFHHADISYSNESFSYLKRSFDLVLCSEVIEHVEDDGLALRNLIEFLTDSGHLILTTQTGPRYRMEREILGHLRHYRTSDLLELIESSGGDVILMQRSGFPWLNLQKILVHYGFRWVKRVMIDQPRAIRFFHFIFSVLRGLYHLGIKGLGPQLLVVVRRKH